MAQKTLKHIALEKGMYQEAQVKNQYLNDILEKEDPSIEYKGTPFENTTALQRQLAERGIKTFGAQADKVSKFFQTDADNLLLFPAVVEQSIRKGLEENNIIQQLVATTTNLGSSDTYKTLIWEDVPADQELRRVSQGGPLPKTQITLGDKEITVFKYGRMLEGTYEAIQNQRLNVYLLQLQRFGYRLALSEVEAAISVLQNGDGGVSGADTYNISTLGGTAGTMAYKPFVKFKGKFKDGYMPNIFLAGEELYTDTVTLDQFNNAFLGYQFAVTGEAQKILGGQPVRCDKVPEDKMIGIDTRFALNRVIANPLRIEYDKLIDTQIERSAVTYTGGFEILDPEARKVLNVGA
ncbi:phage major capsid protein [Brevibacillus centrosporus]|uniref:phage major capsid protein n=1 Tax=Brevibacillus centrosporus TaxID=54910 RepID=UPI002E1ECE36|nr:phage major capsid protein [Brevibacillus centrosporus]MED1954876.1 phage major capsid protein [Brevibacillus centrosporus]